jgi:hypothetical protein
MRTAALLAMRSVFLGAKCLAVAVTISSVSTCTIDTDISGRKRKTTSDSTASDEDFSESSEGACAAPRGPRCGGPIRLIYSTESFTTCPESTQGDRVKTYMKSIAYEVDLALAPRL